MGWTLTQNKAGHKVWQASEYTDLRHDEINKLAEWGQPYSPYEDEFDHDFVPDFQNVIIRMPHKTVMNDGHGKNIRPTDFPLVNKFLSGQIDVPDGSYSFKQLESKPTILKSNRRVVGNLYGWGSSIPTTPGAISAGDAAYVYGTVGYALMHSTHYEKQGHFYTVRGEIGVLDDNWDFESDHSMAKRLNPLVAAFFGPSHYNLEPKPNVDDDTMGRIEIEYFGPGKPFFIRNFAPPQ